MNKQSSSNKKIRRTKKAEPISPPTETPPPETPKPDIIDDFMFRAADYIYRKRKLFISLGVAAAFLLISAYGTLEYIDYKDDLRSAELYKIEKQIYDSSLSEEKRFEKTLPMLNDFVAKHSQTKQWSAALFYRADLYYKQKRYQEAESDLQTVLFSLEKNSSMSAIAGICLSNVLWDQDKSDEAIQVLESLKAENMVEIILMELAEKYLSSEQNQKAKRTLELLLKDFPQTQYRAKINQLLKII